MRIERSYLTRIVQTYEVPDDLDTTDLYEQDEAVLEGRLISDDYESVDYDELTLSVVEKPEHPTTGRARTLTTRLVELQLLLGTTDDPCLVPNSVAHYAVEALRRDIPALLDSLNQRPEGVVGSGA